MEAFGIIGFIFGLGALGKIIMLEETTQRIGCPERKSRIWEKLNETASGSNSLLTGALLFVNNIYRLLCQLNCILAALQRIYMAFIVRFLVSHHLKQKYQCGIMHIVALS